jgi:pyridoxal phosphate enzyme (YggS family)
MLTLAERIEGVQERILRAAQAVARDAKEIRLVAVSKTVEPEAVRSAYACGLRDFGENYVQELSRKAEALADLVDLRWHLIGHLQRNKVRQAVRVASLVHTVHSLDLVSELGRRFVRGQLATERRFAIRGRPPSPGLPVLVEVNLGGEAQKAGCAPEELATILAAIEAQPALELAGLMSVPPHTEDPEGARAVFERLGELRALHGGPVRLPELSMGMTHDLEVAVRAHATLVRVGSAIFGERPPKRPPTR